MEEIWKTHDNFENYEFSSHGRFRKADTGFILKQTISIDSHRGRTDGYIITFLLNRHTQKRQRVRLHRIIGELFVPNPNPTINITINHIDGDKTNNHYTNLEWISVADNNRHSHNLIKQKKADGTYVRKQYKKN